MQSRSALCYFAVVAIYLRVDSLEPHFKSNTKQATILESLSYAPVVAFRAALKRTEPTAGVDEVNAQGPNTGFWRLDL